MILVVLPKNNPLDLIKPKPVVSAMLPYITYSKFLDICVFSPFSDNPNNFVTNKIFSKKNSTKKTYTKSVLIEIQNLLTNGEKICVIEVHQDVKLAGNIAKKFPDIKVSVVKHNNYCINRFKEKFCLLRAYYYYRYIKYLHSIYCNSNYVSSVIAKNYPLMKSKTFTIYNSFGHIKDAISKLPVDFSDKKDQIVFAGKPVNHKGIKEFISALPDVLKKHTSYKAIIIGAFFSKKNKYSKTIKEIISSSELKNLISEGRIVFLKNLTPDLVFKNMLESKLVVVPSKSNEPFGLVCLEAHLAKCAVISSGRGGLKEVSGEYALYLDSVSPIDISSKLNFLIENSNEMSSLAKDGHDYAFNKFDPQKLVVILDAKRSEIINAS